MFKLDYYKLVVEINHKDIGTLYLYYGAMAGIVGTLFSIFSNNKGNVEGRNEKKFYNELNLENDFVLWMKVLKNIGKRNMKKNSYERNFNNNKNYSTRVELVENYKNKLYNKMKGINNEKGNYNFKESLEKKFEHPITVEKGKDIDKENVELMFVSETSKGKNIKEGNKQEIETYQFEKDKYIPGIIYKDIINKNELKMGEIVKEDKKFKYIVENENNKIEVINQLGDKFKEFDVNKYEGGCFNEYNGERWDKNENFYDFINKFFD